MQEHQKRVVDEKAELDIKIGKLTQFVEGDVFKGLDDAERGRLVSQLATMREYSSILGERIGAFS